MVNNESNNWIMPEIFQKIKETRFVIVDFSLQCNGAYYEAGYAEALWKNVIQLCNTKGKRFLHFDISQKATIIYKSLNDDLEKRIIDRIKATIGDPMK